MLQARRSTPCVPLFRPTQSPTRGKIILATVKGDIHDIGKNICRALLENYGFKVIDLGHDVPLERIAAATKRKQVRLAETILH